MIWKLVGKDIKLDEFKKAMLLISKTFSFVILLSLLIVGFSTTSSVYAQTSNWNDISFEFTDSKNQVFVKDNNLSQQIQQLINRKKEAEKLNDRSYAITNLQENPNSIIFSVSSLNQSDILKYDNHHETIDISEKVVYFNLIFIRENGIFRGYLDNDLKPSLLQSQSVLNNIDISALSSVTGNLQPQSNNRYRDYKFAWKAGEAWQTEITFNNQPWGWHNDHVGPALDFLPPANSSLEVLAGSSGYVEWLCTTDLSRNQAGVHIRTVVNNINYGESLRYYHIRKDMLAVGYQAISEGQYLGRLKEGGNSGYPGCNLYSYNTHIHWGFPAKDFEIQGILFDSPLNIGTCPLYSTNALPNNPPAGNYQPMAYIPWIDGSPCNSGFVILYNPNNFPVKVRVKMGQSFDSAYTVNAQQVLPINILSLRNVPVFVYTENGSPIIVTHKLTTKYNSFNEFSAFSSSKLDSKYYYPWYFHKNGVSTYVAIANPNSNSISVQLKLGNPNSPVAVQNISVPAGKVSLAIFSNQATGPLTVEATNSGDNKFFTNLIRFGSNNQMSQFKGITAQNLDNKYFYPWYESAGSSNSFLAIANPNSTPANVKVTIGKYSNPNVSQTFSVPAGGVILPQFKGVQAGPAIVESLDPDVNIVSSLIGYYNNVSEAQYIGITANDMHQQLYFPYYESLNGNSANLYLSNPHDKEIDLKIVLGNQNSPVAVKNIKIGPYETSNQYFPGTASQGVTISYDGSDATINSFYAIQKMTTFNKSTNIFPAIPLLEYQKNIYFTDQN